MLDKGSLSNKKIRPSLEEIHFFIFFSCLDLGLDTWRHSSHLANVRRLSNRLNWWTFS